MNELDQRMSELRAVLTETLPFELPFGFTNENLFLSELKKDELSEIQQKYLNALRWSNSDYTKPYLYKINRSHRSKNTLGLIHPTVQLRMAEFYSNFEQTFIQSCSKSTFSIRYPSEALRIYSKGSSKDVRKRWSMALPEEKPGKDIKTPYSASFFGYRKYLLLDRFFSSNEIVRLEARYSKLRMLDVSRCFFNIYTHSISWALKEKDFSKQYSQKFSFEQQFDTLMQHANYNETAGILVGPEVSRIFAEIILQRIDVELEHFLEDRFGYVADRHYTIRRYVDDFHIFANETEKLDRIEASLAQLLENYKLFLNTEKSETIERPFVTGISRVKFEVARVCTDLKNTLLGLLSHPDVDDGQAARNLRSGARASLDALRHIGGTERKLLASSMSEVFRTLGQIIEELKPLTLDDLVPEQREDFLSRVKVVVRVLFYLLALDFRVPPLIRASLLIKSVVSMMDKFPESDRKATHGYLVYELSELIASNYDERNSDFPLEILNVFILGLIVDPDVFVSQKSCDRVLQNVLIGKHQCYFSVLCALHILNSCSEINPDTKAAFVERMKNRILAPEFEIRMSCENYLIFCDFLSCPAIDRDVRWDIVCSKIGIKGLSKLAFDELAECFRHTNWTNGGAGFEIVKRRLPPVYFSG